MTDDLVWIEPPLPPCRYCSLAVERIDGVWTHRCIGRPCSSVSPDTFAEPDPRYVR